MSSIKSTMPKGIINLHFINVLTTFGYAIIYSSLTIYLVKNFKISHHYANSIVGLFIAVNFVLHLFGGYMGGRLLSNRVLFTVTIFFQMIGLYILSMPDQNFLFLGLSVFLVGCGINMTCYNCIFTQQFKPDDPRQETAFFYNYCAMNAGFFIGFVVSGYFDVQGNYHALLYISNLFNILTLILLVFSWKYLADKGTPFTKKTKKNRIVCQGVGVVLLCLLVPVICLAFRQAHWANKMVIVLGIAVILFIYARSEKRFTVIERNKIHSFLILTIASIVFWMLYYVGPIGISHFLKSNVDVTFYDYQVPPQWIMNLNAIFIIAGSPVLAYVLTRMRRYGFDMSLARQFACALVAMALSFFSLSMGIKYCSTLGLTSLVWVVIHFLLQALGELLIVPVGLAMTGKLAPANLQGIMMGLWLMVPGISATLSQYCSNRMTQSETLNPLVSNPDYLDAFNQTGWYAMVAAVLLLLLAAKIDKFVVVPPEPCADGYHELSV